MLRLVIHDPRVRHTQCGHIMLGELTQNRLALHIRRMTEHACHIGEIHAEPAGQIDQQAVRGGIGTDDSLGDAGLVPRRGLRGALLHRQVRRVNYAITCRPVGKLRTGRLPSGDLVERQRQINGVTTLRMQRQIANILHTVRRNERTGLIIHHPIIVGPAALSGAAGTKARD